MLKFIILLMVLLSVDHAFSQGDAPAILRGQNQTQKSVGATIVAPALSVTKVSASTALIETGNDNILENPGFENATYDTAWTVVNGTTSVETTNYFSGLKAMKITASSGPVEVIASSPVNSVALADGVQMIATIMAKNTMANIQLCSRIGTTTSTTNCVSLLADNTWRLYKLPFISGAVRNGFAIKSTANTTGTLIIDNAYVGVVDLKVDTNNISNWTSFTPTGTWNTNVTYSGRWRRVGDTAEIEYRALTSGAPNSANFALDVPSFIGVVDTSKMISDPLGFSNLGSRVDVLKSGGNRYQGYAYYDASLSRVFAYTIKTFSGANPVYNGIEGVTSTVPVTFANGDSVIVKVSLPIVGWASSGSIYSSTNADTDWAACNFSTLAWQGLGTVGATTKCKRQGSDLLVRGDFSTGTVAAAQAQIPLPLWNGQQLTIASSSKNMNGIASGRLTRLNTTANNLKDYVILAPSSASYLTISAPEYALTFNALSGQNGNAIFNTGDYSMYEYRVPIEGWENSNIIIGQFNGLESCTDTYQCTDVFSAKIDAAGVVSAENIDWISGNASIASTSQYTITFRSGVFSTTPNCVIGAADFSTNIVNRIFSQSATGLSYFTYAPSTGTATASQINITCQKTGADFIGKTAKAVASDQNVRSVGSVGVDIQRVYFGSGANCTSACTTGTCSICSQTGTKITSVTFQSTGLYRLNGIDGTKYGCTGSGYNPTGAKNEALIHDPSASTSTYALVATNPNVNVGYISVMCIGIP